MFLPIFPTDDFSRYSTFSERLANIDLKNVISSSLCLNSDCNRAMFSSVLVRYPYEQTQNGWSDRKRD